MKSQTLAALAFILSIGLAASADAQVKLGVAGPFSGRDSAFGTQVRMGAEQAVSDINSAGGILGQRLIASFEDDAADVKLGGAIANKFAADGTKFVIGHVNSDVTLAASEIYLRNDMVEITPASTNPRITERGMWNVFRACGRDDQQGLVAANYILKNFKGKKVVIIHDNTAYGLGLAEEVRKGIRAGGMQEALFDGVNAGARDYSEIVLKIKPLNPDLVYWGGLDREAASIIKEMRDERMKALLMSGDGIASEEFAEITGSDAVGTLMTYQPDPRKRPEAKAIVDRFRSHGFEPETYTLYSYAAIQILKQAAELGRSLEPKKVAQEMASGTRFKTVIGDLSFNKKGDVLRSDYITYVWKKDNRGNFAYAEAR